MGVTVDAAAVTGLGLLNAAELRALTPPPSGTSFSAASPSTGSCALAFSVERDFQTLDAPPLLLPDLDAATLGPVPDPGHNSNPRNATTAGNATSGVSPDSHPMPGSEGARDDSIHRSFAQQQGHQEMGIDTLGNSSEGRQGVSAVKLINTAGQGAPIQGRMLRQDSASRGGNTSSVRAQLPASKPTTKPSVRPPQVSNLGRVGLGPSSVSVASSRQSSAVIRKQQDTAPHHIPKSAASGQLRGSSGATVRRPAAPVARPMPVAAPIRGSGGVLPQKSQGSGLGNTSRVPRGPVKRNAVISGNGQAQRAWGSPIRSGVATKPAPTRR